MRANQRLELIFDIGDQEIGYLEKSDFNNICAQLRALFSDSLILRSIVNLIGPRNCIHPTLIKVQFKILYSRKIYYLLEREKYERNGNFK